MPFPPKRESDCLSAKKPSSGSQYGLCISTSAGNVRRSLPYSFSHNTTNFSVGPAESLRTTTQFCRIFEMVEKREAESRDAFVNAGGERILQEELHACKDEYWGL